MKIRLASDLHLDHYTSYTQAKIINAITSTETPYDVLALAGDISEGPKVVGFLRQICEAVEDRTTRIFYVPGNHDYASLGDLLPEKLHELEVELLMRGIKFLTLHVNGQATNFGIHGTTFWYPYSVEALRFLENSNWYDLRAIPRFRQLWQERSRVEEMLFASAPVMMTHFLPSYDVVAPQYAGDPTNVFYVNQRGDDIMREHKPKLWMFGHTHVWTDKMVHETRCVSRPFGYPRESEKLDYRNWHRDCTFEVEA